MICLYAMENNSKPKEPYAHVRGTHFLSLDNMLVQLETLCKGGTGYLQEISMYIVEENTQTRSPF